jgi:hypothetical protein
MKYLIPLIIVLLIAAGCASLYESEINENSALKLSVVENGAVKETSKKLSEVDVNQVVLVTADGKETLTLTDDQKYAVE